MTILDSLCPFQPCYNLHTMAPIAQPYSQDTCGIGYGYGASSALGWAESWFGIDRVEMKWSPLNCFHINTFLSFRPPKPSLSLVDSSPNCQHKLIVASDGWHSARKPTVIRLLSFLLSSLASHCPCPIVVIIIVDVIDVVVVVVAAIAVHVTFVVLYLFLA